MTRPRRRLGGWGHALTGDAWYRDMMRLEYIRNF